MKYNKTFREALEEVGLKLKNITYKYSQYWPFTNNLMLGFEATVYAQKNKIKILSLKNT